MGSVYEGGSTPGAWQKVGVKGHLPLCVCVCVYMFFYPSEDLNLNAHRHMGTLVTVGT